jgi:hypothetical protein
MKAEAFLSGTDEVLLTQLNWIKSELEYANRNRDRLPWLFVGLHNPVYCSPNWRLPLPKHTGGPRYNEDCGMDVDVL